MGYSVKLIDRLLNKTKDGFVKENVVIARIGAMDYSGSELGMGFRDHAKVEAVADGDELFSPDTIESLEGMPVTIEHPSTNEVTPETFSELGKGHIQNIYQDGDYLKGTIFIHDADAIEFVENGIKEVSLGYDSDIIEKNGKLVKTNIRANHLAIVPEGRCGSACKIGDSKKVKTTMAKKPVALKVGDSIAKMFGLKTSAHKAVSRKFGDTKKSIHSTKAKLGDAAKKTLKDVELGLAAEATEEEKAVALEAVATLSTEIEQAIEILNGADESVTEAEEAVEEITVNDATLPEGVSIPEELAGYVNELEQERAAAEEKLADAEIRIKELEDELAALKADGETATAVADAKARFPKIKLGDAKSARDVQAQVLVAKGIYTDAQAKTLTDCAIGSAYQALAVTSTKPAPTIGQKLLGDSKTQKVNRAAQLGGKK